MRTFEGETYWAASDIGWVTCRHCAWMQMAVTWTWIPGGWAFIHCVRAIASRMCYRAPLRLAWRIWLGMTANYFHGWHDWIVDPRSCRYFMKESPLVGSPSNVKTKCLAFIFEHTKGTPDAGAFWRVIQARVNKTAMNHACFCRLNCVYLVRESFKCKLDASQFAFSFISFLILGMKSDCIGFTRCIHACFSIFFQSFAGFPFWVARTTLYEVCLQLPPPCVPFVVSTQMETSSVARWRGNVAWCYLGCRNIMKALRKPLPFSYIFRGHFTSHQWVEFLVYCGFEIALQFCKATSVCTENAFLKEWDPRCPSTCPSHRLSLPERSPWLLPTEMPLISKSVVYRDRSAQRVLIAKPLCGGWTMWSWNVPWWKTVEEDIEVNHLRYLRLIPRSKFFATTLQTGFYDNWWQTETGRQIWNTLTCSAGTQQRM